MVVEESRGADHTAGRPFPEWVRVVAADHHLAGTHGLDEQPQGASSKTTESTENRST